MKTMMTTRAPRRVPRAHRCLSATTCRRAFSNSQNPSDPFAAAQPPTTRRTTTTTTQEQHEDDAGGFKGTQWQSMQDSEMPSLAKSAQLLRAFTSEQLDCTSHADAKTDLSDVQRDAIQTALAVVAANSVDPFLMGICAPTQAEAVQALKVWVAALGLPKGLLHGMDRQGVAVKVEGGVYVKYHSGSGDAVMSGYDGKSVGVLVTPAFASGDFLQVGYFPLTLFPSS